MGGTDHATGRTDRPVLLVPAPSSRSSMRRRGRWHMRALAVRAARMLSHQGFDVRVIPLLRTTGVSSKSVQMNTIAQRSHRLAGRIAVQRRVFNQHNTTDGDEMRVILLDDIITSGATATYCVQALRDVGAEVLAVVTLAYTPDPRQART
ncbi:ComF family protein [Bifidobacterium goeldii]|nr:phosphoribosyltransferase [Bifidobacterium goeldii]